METVIHLLQTRGVRWAGALFIALFCVLFISAPKPTHAENERVITIFHDGIQQTVVTDAVTIDEALKRANITLDSHDAVEPVRDTKLAAPSYDVNVYRAKPVTVVDGNNRYDVMSPHTSARQIAADAGITMYDEDGYQLTRIDDFIVEGGVGLKLTIDRATPLTFVLYGKSTQIRTQSKTVGDLLKEKKVTLGEQDGSSALADTPIAPGMSLTVWRNGVTTSTNEEPVQFTTRQILDADQPIGYKAVQTPGVAGKKMVTYQIEMKDGKEISRKVIQSVVTQEAKEQTEVVGAKAPVDLSQHKTEVMAAVGIAQSDYGFVDYIIGHESGWCATKLQGHPGACPALPPTSIPAGYGYGLCQSTPGSKMASAGSDWQTNPITQLKWCNSYAVSRFGSWGAAYNYWLAHHNW
jgi:uncharacterized protein YabE (DUF348 family)